MLTKSSAESTPVKPLDLFGINCRASVTPFLPVCVFANQTQVVSITPGIPLVSALEENRYDIRRDRW